MEKIETAIAVSTLFSIDTDHVLVPSIQFVQDKVQKHNQGKFSHLARFSRESFVEYLLEQGINSVGNAVDADMERRNKDAYVKAMSRLSPPTSTDAAGIANYLNQVNALRVKYGIGGSQKEV